jgi:hypothetical protein
MKRLWIALSALTGGLWLVVWRTRLRKTKRESLPEAQIVTSDIVGAQHVAPLSRINSNEPSVSLKSLVPDVRRQRMIQNTGLAVFGVVLGLAMVWLGARLFLRQEQTPQVSLPSVAVAGCEPAEGDWVFAMMASGFDYVDACRDYFWHQTPFEEFYNNVRLNNFGFHDTDFTFDKPEGVYRILILGDSFPRGEEVPLTNGFPYLLERQFNTENDGSRPTIEVINLSVPAIGTDRELLLYAGLGWRFQADVVLLCLYTGNDIRDNEINLEHLQYGYRIDRPFFTLEGGILTLHNSPTPLEAERHPDSVAWQWFINMQGRQTDAPPENPPTRPIVLSRDPYETEYPVDLGLYLPQDDYWRNAWNLTEALLLQMRELVESQGSRFGVVMIPDRRAVHSEDWQGTTHQFPIAAEGSPLSPIADLAVFMQQNGITNINLRTALNNHVEDFPNSRLYFPIDGHFNVDGHAVTEEAIHDWLLQQGWIPATVQ